MKVGMIKNWDGRIEPRYVVGGWGVYCRDQRMLLGSVSGNIQLGTDEKLFIGR